MPYYRCGEGVRAHRGSDHVHAATKSARPKIEVTMSGGLKGVQSEDVERDERDGRNERAYEREDPNLIG
jgi:hypothetical protein